VTAALAVLLTMGTMNAYVAAATRLAGALAAEGSAPHALARPGNALALIALVGAALLVPLGFELLSLDGLVRATSASFVAVYVVATAAGIRLLSGAARGSAAVAFIAVTVVFAFSGLYLLVPGAVALATFCTPRKFASKVILHSGRYRGAPCRSSSPASRAS
jgi:amino acid efflux transporter